MSNISIICQHKSTKIILLLEELDGTYVIAIKTSPMDSLIFILLNNAINCQHQLRQNVIGYRPAFQCGLAPKRKISGVASNFTPSSFRGSSWRVPASGSWWWRWRVGGQSTTYNFTQKIIYLWTSCLKIFCIALNLYFCFFLSMLTIFKH